jgi:chaperone modulatory protein CbpM
MTQSTALVTHVEFDFTLSFDEMQRSCACSSEWLLELVQEGALEPQGTASAPWPLPSPAEWRFTAAALRRARVAARLARDLQLNAAGAALVLDLLDEIDALRR